MVTPEPIDTKFDVGDYVGDVNSDATIHNDRLWVSQQISDELLSYNYGRPMEWGRPLHFCPVVSIFFYFSLPNLSGRRLDVYHTSTHGVALVRI